MARKPFDIEEICKQFSIKGVFTGYEKINNGHINSTYNLIFDDNNVVAKYVLQKINTNVFKNPDELMSNIVAVTEHIRKKYEENNVDCPERRTLSFFPCLDGKYYYTDKDNQCWRLYTFVDYVYSFNSIDSEEIFYNAGAAFGEFQDILSDFDGASLFETIKNFHHTASRFNDLKKAIDDNKANRLDSVKDEVEFALQREADTHVLVDMIAEGKLPLRVTHNDTKLNNILFDNITNKGICIIDLDTVMPGLSLYDFGDSIRFGANTAAEDEKDVSKVSLSLSLYEAYVNGYLSSAKDTLTDLEKELLPFGAKIMTYECGIRFLADYLNGDVYFKTEYPEHNLVRCRTQFALVKDMEDKMEKMMEITKKYC
ncbi:MAG: phosphotransferase [Clostridia bacterium]|nr:phosphotransferase [Clostridia bacterium]